MVQRAIKHKSGAHSQHRCYSSHSLVCFCRAGNKKQLMTMKIQKTHQRRFSCFHFPGSSQCICYISTRRREKKNNCTVCPQCFQASCTVSRRISMFVASFKTLKVIYLFIYFTLMMMVVIGTSPHPLSHLRLTAQPVRLSQSVSTATRHLPRPPRQHPHLTLKAIGVKLWHCNNIFGPQGNTKPTTRAGLPVL